jgi:uncharacterized protein YoxC
MCSPEVEMNSIDTKNLRDEDGHMNERVANLEKIAEETAIRLGSLERKVDGLAHDLAVLTQTVAGLSPTVDELSRTVDELSRTVDELSRTVDELSRIVGELSQAVSKLTQEMGKLSQDVALLAQTAAAHGQGIAALTQTVAALAAQLNKIEIRLGIIENTFATKEYLQKALHGMTWRIIGAMTLLTSAVWFISRYNPPYNQPAPVSATTPAAPALPPRLP